MILIQILNKIFIEIYITKNNIFILKINKNFFMKKFYFFIFKLKYY